MPVQNLPHHYQVSAQAEPDAIVQLTSPGLPDLDSAAPAEFGGPGDRWSPETLLTGAVADCFILSFKAIARASRFEWDSLSCEVEGVLDRVERTMLFTRFQLRVTLAVPANTEEKRAMLLLEKAKHSCLVTNSLKSECHLEAEVRISKGN